MILKEKFLKVVLVDQLLLNLEHTWNLAKMKENDGHEKIDKGGGDIDFGINMGVRRIKKIP